MPVDNITLSFSAKDEPATLSDAELDAVAFGVTQTVNVTATTTGTVRATQAVTADATTDLESARATVGVTQDSAPAAPV
jgi:hypothetical protein